MGNILSRLAKLERRIPAAHDPQMAIIMTNGDRHEIRRVNNDVIYLYVPWDDAYEGNNGDPESALTDEQRQWAERAAKVVVLCLAPIRGPDGSPLDLDWWEADRPWP
jgi:hypothetical protein